MIALAFIACSDRHHPDNFAGGAVHGPALKLQSEDCRECHGDDLTGGTSAISCDGCHAGATPTAWRQNCTFCHGGVENETGAPPRNIHGTDLIGPFPAHPLHVSGGAVANAYDCSQCHDKASDVLSPGHVFDDTPGNAENDYGNGLSPQTTFARDSGTCSNVYCHGSGRLDDGVIAASAGPLPCSGCHPTLDSGAGGWGKMSGPHAAHMAATGISCATCHSETTADGTTIASKEQHINGRRDVEIDEPNFTYDQTRKLCTGSCHGFSHNGLGWVGGGGYHPPGFGAASVHGPELELQRQDCRGCHGDDLRGGTTGILGPSCDTCHTPNWRTTCTFCHGGGIDQSGAPPRDLGSSILNSAQSFAAHPKHVAPKMMTANDCTTCHVKPGDALSMNHAFDSTPMQAEVNLTLDGRNPGATYNGTGTCANLYCHGNGRTNGTYTDGGAAATCTTCHGGKANGKLNLSTLHRDHHLPYECNECHRSVVATGSTVISNPALHIDRTKQIQFLAPNFTMTNGLCNGACHNKQHTNEPW